jgi:hypothetical protein
MPPCSRTHRWRVHALRADARKLQRLIEEALTQVKTLRGLLPVCAGCKKIRDDTGYWNHMETYLAQHSEVDFSHGLCPACVESYYPDYAAAVKSEEP